MQAEKPEIMRLDIVGSTVKIYASGEQASVTFASLLKVFTPRALF